MNWKEYPEDLIKGRESAEATFIFCLWKQPELYDDFARVNTQDDETLKTEDGIFYFSLGRQMFNQGFKSFDNVTIYTFLENKPTVKKHFDELGGYPTVSELCSLVNVENIDAYYDKIAKMNTLMTLYDKGFNVIPNMDRFAKMTNQEVYDYYDYILNSVSIKNTHDIDIETLEIDDKFLSECDDGSAQGISYGKNCPILNYLTLGTPLGDMYMFAGHSGVGKALAVTEPVLTPEGFKLMGDIQLGDLVIGEDGRSYPVVGVFPQGKRDAYKVTFKDGVQVICDENHLWKFKTFSDIRNNRGWKVESLNSILNNYKFTVNNGTYNLYIPVAKPIFDFEKQDDLTIPPYALGLLIGDGYIANYPLNFDNPENDLVNKLNNLLENYGGFEKYKDTIKHEFKSNTPWKNELIDQLRTLGLFGKKSTDKFIPNQYLMASYEDRLDLLRGLIDTDGHVNNKGAVSYSTKSKQLANDIVFLVRSLGYRCSFHEYNRAEKGIDYVIRIFAKTDLIFTSTKHQERFNQRMKLERVHKYEYLPIVKIEKLPEQQKMQCIMVDSPDHTFLCRDFIVTHNTSFVFENMIIPMTDDGVKCAVISNEQRSKDFKQLLLVHILTNDLDYWGLTRKKLKMGKFTDEQWEYLRKAKQISREKYSNIQFIKMFDNDMNKVKRIIKKLAKLGYQTIMFDTMKSEDEIDEAMWQQLLIHSRKLFQITSRENISLICTYQLALHTLNKRYLDASCLSNAKQIKEVFSEMVYCRPLWDDEFPGEKFDVKPYQLKKDSSGKYSNVRESVQLDRDKKYIIAFLDKTRNDDDKIQVLYEFNGRFNRWREKGYCSVFNEHK